ncbi:MAG TPA: hypothetical protein VG323_15975 [Thermoanaerobaculia bacterium]|nr:hypothetical protein [Thermoanaerobaculia bacterium]
MAPSLQRPAKPGALPSGITAVGLDDAGPMRQLALVVVLAVFWKRRG